MKNLFLNLLEYVYRVYTCLKNSKHIYIEEPRLDELISNDFYRIHNIYYRCLRCRRLKKTRPDLEEIESDFSYFVNFDFKHTLMNLDIKFKKGNVHNEEGPVVITKYGGVKFYYLNNKKYDSKEEWFENLSSNGKIKILMNPEKFDGVVE